MPPVQLVQPNSGEAPIRTRAPERDGVLATPEAQVRTPETIAEKPAEKIAEAIKPEVIPVPVEVSPAPAKEGATPMPVAAPVTARAEATIPKREAVLYEHLSQIAKTDPHAAVDRLRELRAKELAERFGVKEELPVPTIKVVPTAPAPVSVESEVRKAA